MNEFVKIYRYIYYRLYLHHVNAWQGHKGLAKLNSSNAMAGSAMAVYVSLDLILLLLFDVSILLEDWWILVFLGGSTLLFQSFILPSDPEILENKFSREKDSLFRWRVKGFLSLAFVFGPLLLIAILTYLNIPD